MATGKRLQAILLGGIFLLAGSSAGAMAQDWHPGGGGPPSARGFQGGGMMHGRWWNDPKIAQQIGLTPDQQKKMDDIMQQNRLKLIDLDAALQKQETIMQPLMEADQPDEAKVLAQIDAIAQARAELEKGNARMLFGIRQTLTPDQWKKLRALRASRAAEGPRSWGHRDGDGFRGGPGRFGKGDAPAPPPPAGNPPPQ